MRAGTLDDPEIGKPQMTVWISSAPNGARWGPFLIAGEVRVEYAGRRKLSPSSTRNQSLFLYRDSFAEPSVALGTAELVESFDGGTPTLLRQQSLPKDPDRSHLADEIHFMDLIRLADEELPAARAMVERSKAVAVTARAELDEHQRWLGRHQELYAQAVEGCERRLKRKAFIGACKQSASLPFQLLTTAWTGLFHAGLTYPRRRRLKAKLKDRLQELDHPSEHQFARQLQKRIQAMDRRGLR